MSHALIKSTLIPEIIRQIAKEYQIDEAKAMDDFYNSDIAAALDDDETGLYGQSALYIFSLYHAGKDAGER
ncbi:MAG: hypothetical protein LBS91_09640 [Clostridiales Family XIII bacterium]|jgi:hypothetical protein|nr:hypothetical protein [Clostridiales Family XIII bacterium]